MSAIEINPVKLTHRLFDSDNSPALYTFKYTTDDGRQQEVPITTLEDAMDLLYEFCGIWHATDPSRDGDIPPWRATGQLRSYSIIEHD